MRDRLGPLPDGYVLVEGARGALACPREITDDLAAAGFTPDARRGDERLPDAEESGREPLGKLRVGGVDALVRRFSHGGLARAVTGRRFRDPARPFEELRLSERLRGLGIATPKVLAARAVRAGGYGFELSLVTERLAGTVDVGRLLGQVRSREVPKAVLRRAIADAGALVGALHAEGFVHADLQPANLLVRPEGARGALALDLDRSTFEGSGPLSRDRSLRNLARLWRHVRRREERYGAVLTPGDLALFLDRFGASPSERGSTAAEIDRRAGEGGGWHRLGWALERTFGRRHDARAAGRT